MAKFEPGKKYKMNSVCDSNCWWFFTVARRTAKSVWLDDGKEVKRCLIKNSEHDGEYVLPFGRYSMAPILRACRPA